MSLFKTVDYDAALDLTVRLGDCLPPDHLARSMMERATYESVPFRFIAGNRHPDHDTIAVFRHTFLPDLKGCSCRCCCWRKRPGCSRWARSAWTGPRSTPTPP